MTRGHWWILGVCCLIVSCGQEKPVQGSLGPPEPRVCEHQGGGAAYMGGPPVSDTVTVSNDGNWCSWTRATILAGTSEPLGVPMRVTQQPAHGEITITVMAAATKIAYKPAAGFTGTDRFTLVNQKTNIERSTVVTVTQ